MDTELQNQDPMQGKAYITVGQGERSAGAPPGKSYFGNGPAGLGGPGNRGTGDIPKVKTIPLKVIIVTSICLFTVGPALLLWLLSLQEGNNGIDSIYQLSQSSIEDVTLQLRTTMVANASNTFLDFVEPSERAMLFLSYYMKGLGIQEMNGQNLTDNFGTLAQQMDNIFHVVRSNSRISVLGFWVYTGGVVTSSTMLQATMQYISYTRMNYDVKSGNFTDTIYFTSQTVNTTGATLSHYYVDQSTGEILSQFSTQQLTTAQAQISTPIAPANPEMTWATDYDFNPYTGHPCTLR